MSGAFLVVPAHATNNNTTACLRNDFIAIPHNQRLTTLNIRANQYRKQRSYWNSIDAMIIEISGTQFSSKANVPHLLEVRSLTNMNLYKQLNDPR